MSFNFGIKATKIIVKGKHFIGREFQSLAVRGKKLVRDILVISRNGDRNIYIQSHSLAIK